MFVSLLADVVISDSLSAEDRNRLEGYLAQKWGIQNRLPVSHPYVDSPLTINVP